MIDKPLGLKTKNLAKSRISDPKSGPNPIEEICFQSMLIQSEGVANEGDESVGHRLDGIEMDHLKGGEGFDGFLCGTLFFVAADAVIVADKHVPDATQHRRVEMEYLLRDFPFVVGAGEVEHSEVEEWVAPAEVANRRGLWL